MIALEGTHVLHLMVGLALLIILPCTSSCHVMCQFQNRFLLAGRKFLFVALVVVLLLQRWLNYGRLQKRKEKTKNRLPNFSNIKAKHKNHQSTTTRPSIDVQSVQRSHNDFLRPMKHDLAASDEIARRGSLHEFVSTVLYDTLGQTEP